MRTIRTSHRYRGGAEYLLMVLAAAGCAKSSTDQDAPRPTSSAVSATANPATPPLEKVPPSTAAGEHHDALKEAASPGSLSSETLTTDTVIEAAFDTSPPVNDEQAPSLVQTKAEAALKDAAEIDESPSTASGADSSRSDAPTSEWRQFRGTDGQGLSSESGLPLHWSEKKNIVWKVPIRGQGWSSPVITQDRVWLTTAVAAEKSLRVLCLDAKTGKIIHDVEVFRLSAFGGIHPKNSHASPTPVIANDRCYVHFGAHGTAALDLNGRILWKTKIDYYHHHGPASSPVVVDGLLIVNCDGQSFSFYDDRKIDDPPDPQFMIALDAESGEVRWKKRRDGAHSYSTPLVIEVEGKTQVISSGGNWVYAYDPQSGDEIWSCAYQGYSVVPRPVFGHGLVFVCTGYDSPKLLAIRPDGRREVTETHILWKATKAVPLDPSPIIVGDELYTVSNQGVVTCYEATTGKVHWKHRIGGNHSASPISGNGYLYFLDEGGTTSVLECGLKPKVIAKNALPGKTQASLAASGRALFLRNDKHLYRIEEPGPKVDAETHAEQP